MTRATPVPSETLLSTNERPTVTFRRGDAIDQWLGMFTRFLRLPYAQSRAIKDELDSHMRERVRDLMLEGLSEDEGMRRAIDELGEAAELAAHFRAAHRPNRRMLMSIAAIGVAAGAAVISVVALTKSQPAGKPGETLSTANVVRAQTPLARVETAGIEIGGETIEPRFIASDSSVPVLSNIPVVNRLFAVSNAAPPTDAAPLPAHVAGVKVNADVYATNFREVAELLAKQAELKLSLQTDPGFDTRAKIDSIQFVEDDLTSAFRRLNGALKLAGPSRLDFRVRDGVLEVASRDSFDRLETTLIAYDLTDAYRAEASADGLVQTVTQFVETDGWRNNGGETASLKIVGNKMFVEAPPRYHERVAWILNQFSGSRKGAAPRAAGRLGFLNKTVAAEAPAADVFGQATAAPGQAGSPFGAQAAVAAGVPAVAAPAAPAAGGGAPAAAVAAQPAVPGQGAASAPAPGGAPAMPGENKP